MTRGVILGLLAGALAVLLGAGSGAAAVKRPAARQAAKSGWAAAVNVPVPSAGDVSFAEIQVKIARGSRLALPAGSTAARLVFSSRVGGLSIRARSEQWRRLAASTRVYAVVSEVPGAGSSVRDVALIITRRTARGGPAAAQVTVSIPNARAQAGSFWVHGVDRHGYAEVFTARNILATALGNWGRYTRALAAADALRAALDPRIARAPVSAAVSAAHGHLPGPWTGGQHADARVLAVYRLLFSALRNPLAYGALKFNALVPEFIATELANPSLAARWRSVVQHVPVTVPDQYAALAQEEGRFAHVTPARLSRASVSGFDPSNSGSENGSDAGGSSSTPPDDDLTVQISAGQGSVTVTPYNPSSSYTGAASYTCSSPTCSYSFASGSVPTFLLTATPDSSTDFPEWSSANGCGDTLPPDVCAVELPPDEDSASATVSFVAGDILSVTTDAGSGSSSADTVASGDFGEAIHCRPVCSAWFAPGSIVTLTATPEPQSVFASWSGCSQTSGTTCTVTMSGAQSVTAEFVASDQLTVALATAGGGVGTVTSNPSGISCGTACAASFQAGAEVTLTAVNGPGADFAAWSGCDATSGATCTVAMSQARNVTATFVTPDTLMVTLIPTSQGGVGTVTSNPSGINCGTVCSASFPPGTPVTLTATNGPNAFFAYWGSGSDQDFSNPLSLTLSASSTNIVANFAY